MVEPATVTYAVIHNPNCPKPFLVRLPRGWLDFKPYHESMDICGFGMTFDEAFSSAQAAALRTQAATQ